MAVKYYVIETKRQEDKKFLPITCASFTNMERARYALVMCQSGWPNNDYRLSTYAQQSVVIKPRKR